jgi:hypothetical protein
MWQRHEQIPVGDDAPSPEQPFRLAARGVVVAKQHQKLRTYAGAKNPRSHYMMPPAEVIIPNEHEVPAGFCYERKLSASIARTGFRNWHMRLISTYIVTDHGIENGVERHTYSFDWNAQRTTLAHHRLRILPAVERDLGDYVDQFHIDDQMVDEWYMRMQFDQVTAGDVELLTQEVSKYTGEVLYDSGSNAA